MKKLHVFRMLMLHDETHGGTRCTNDMLGFGPLEELLERDDIADIMINGPETTYIEVSGKSKKQK